MGAAKTKLRASNSWFFFTSISFTPARPSISSQTVDKKAQQVHASDVETDQQLRMLDGPLAVYKQLEARVCSRAGGLQNQA